MTTPRVFEIIEEEEAELNAHQHMEGDDDFDEHDSVEELAILAAELRAIEVWNGAPEKPVPANATEARRLRRIEILGEISDLLCTASRNMFFSA